MSELVDVIAGRRFEREPAIPCPLCGEWNEPRVIKARYGMLASVAECLPCRLAYQTPRPSDEASQAYMNMRWSSGDSYVADAGAKLTQARKNAQIVREAVPEARTLLDFGAGSGAFVSAAREAGFDAVGVERIEAARARARASYGLELLEAMPEDTHYDVVTLWDVIEHLRDPVALLKWLRSRMAPGGVIVLETGNYENWKRLAQGDTWGLYLLDHQFYFTPASLKMVARKAGFAEFRLTRRGRRIPAPMPAQPSHRDLLTHSLYDRAMKDWPKHGDINVMIALAKVPAAAAVTASRPSIAGAGQGLEIVGGKRKARGLERILQLFRRGGADDRSGDAGA